MADVLIKSDVFSPCGGLCSSFSSRRRKPSFATFSRCYSPPLEAIRSSLACGIKGTEVVVGEGRGEPMKGNLHAYPAQMSLSRGKALKWWEKGIQQNMKEIWSAQDLVESLLNAGNQLVILDFFSPGCGGCRALHPKICQFAEKNPNVQFLTVNYEELKSMCYSLNVHVLPFFRFYRGAHGRLCSFSCTNATIKKFKDALAKHTTDRSSLGPARGLEESELLALAANKDLSFNYTKKQVPVPNPDEAPGSLKLPARLPSLATQVSENKTLVTLKG